MKKESVHFSSNSDEWATPQWLFDELDLRYEFNLDPCCTHKTAKCEYHFTKAEDGLAQNWAFNHVFVNPPYGRKGKGNPGQEAWIKKAFEESLKGAFVVMLIPARTDTKAWHDYCMKGEIYLIKGRLHFELNGKKLKAPAPFPSAIVVFRPYGINNKVFVSYIQPLTKRKKSVS